MTNFWVHFEFSYISQWQFWVVCMHISTLKFRKDRWVFVLISTNSMLKKVYDMWLRKNFSCSQLHIEKAIASLICAYIRYFHVILHQFNCLMYSYVWCKWLHPLNFFLLHQCFVPQSLYLPSLPVQSAMECWNDIPCPNHCKRRALGKLYTSV
jgi:hypothetical protein